MYSASHSTRGRETRIHAIVIFDAVCAHPADEVGVTSELAKALECARELTELDTELDMELTELDIGLTELDMARLVNVLDSVNVVVGEPGAGDAVELRELLRGEPLVGEASGGGNSCGWWRVETIISDVCNAIRISLGVANLAVMIMMSRVRFGGRSCGLGSCVTAVICLAAQGRTQTGLNSSLTNDILSLHSAFSSLPIISPQLFSLLL